jgi:hypothetical protein
MRRVAKRAIYIYIYIYRGLHPTFLGSFTARISHPDN